uniref:Nucleoside diphosphate kinase B putative n=1 Tax=Albugo laibachii Nc14 TaxID=890382 RepID=F0W3S9_9STRA|nr:nucleoside diphosphate kinase B putative [Albugo laibachii Nc14]|eukprot:CCA15749.1 nucleoside diphosphate kinase B putative [Albugo laibachii Nc14]
MKILIVTGAAIRQKAERISSILLNTANPTTAAVLSKLMLSKGWLYRFQQRQGLKSRRTHGEAGSVKTTAIENGCRVLQAVTSLYDKMNFYNMDETAYFYCLIPGKPIWKKRIPGRKKIKKRLTVAVMRNADGSNRIPPLFVGQLGSSKASKKKFTFSNKKLIAIARFQNAEDSRVAFDRLKHLRLDGNKCLQVEQLERDTAKEAAANKKTEVFYSSTPSIPAPLAPHLGYALGLICADKQLHCAPSPLLEYRYPRATEMVVRNIANALMALPDFYRQVLHLMNKMNIPPPFEKDCIPGIFEVSRKKVDARKQQKQIQCSPFTSEAEDDEEAESPSSCEHIAPRGEPVNSIEAQFSIHNHTQSTIRTEQSQCGIKKSTISRPRKRSLNPDVFITKKQHSDNGTERPGTISRLQLEKMRLPPSAIVFNITFRYVDLLSWESTLQSYSVGMPSATVMVSNLPPSIDMKNLTHLFSYVLPPEIDTKELMIEVDSEQSEARIDYPSLGIAAKAVTQLHGVVLEGKPLIVRFTSDTQRTKQEPHETSAHPKSKEKMLSIFDVEGFDASTVWSHADLDFKRMNKAELNSQKAMRNYENGRVSRSLYVKNIAEKVTLFDLFAIFGAVVPSEKLAFLRVAHFTKGKMKGQAFIEFSEPSLAIQALERIHGVVISKKPLIIPDGVQRGLVGEIIKRFETKGYKLVALKMDRPSQQHLEKHYADLAGRPFFPGLIQYMSSGPVVAMVWEGTNVVLEARKMLGATKPSDSALGTIRAENQVLRLYRAMLRDAATFQEYNFRAYAKRRVREEFRKNKTLSAEEQKKAILFGKQQAEVLHRQSVISRMYPPQTRNIMELL